MKKSLLSRPKIRVLIVDHASAMRKVLVDAVAHDPSIDVVGTAPNPVVARNKLVALKPDVMILGTFTKLDALIFLEKVMLYFPTRTVVVGDLSGSMTSHRAFAAGAVDVIRGPSMNSVQAWRDLSSGIISRIKAAALARIPAPTLSTLQPETAASTPSVIAIAASTGGTEALRLVLSQLPDNVPGIVIVQHMPRFFTSAFASSLNDICSIEVKEAEEGDKVLPGMALLAPGDFHMELVKRGGFQVIHLHKAPPLHGVRPAADYLLQSVATHSGAHAVGLILTGMGKDGAAGLLAMREAGARTIVQDEASSIVFGMPKAAIDKGAAQSVVPLDRIATTLLKELKYEAC